MRNIIFIIIIFLLFSCDKGVEILSPEKLNDGINVSTTNQHNIDSVLIANLNNDIANGEFGNIHSFLVMIDNELIVEQYYRSGSRDKIHFIMSVTKAFTSLLTGIAIEKGYIDSEDQYMLDFFPAYKSKEKDSRKHQITIEHLLTMTSGFDWDETTYPIDDHRNSGYEIERSENWLISSLDLKMDTIPSTKYVYCGSNCVILSEIIRATSKKDIADFAEKYLFKPLGIKEYKWYKKNGIFEAGGGLYITSRDMLKFGHLHLNKGIFNGNRIVSCNWIDQTFSPYIETDKPGFHTGYYWDILRSEDGLLVYFRGGRGGQAISIIPDLNMIIVITADNRKKPQSLAPLMERITRIHQDYKLKTNNSIKL
ncbi:MAG: serine hydrolase [Bacteroidetes bacterium]|nr:serine hydrolase [Bacteroidota bacterium]